MMAPMDIPKNVGDLLMSNACILVHVMLHKQTSIQCMVHTILK